MKQNAGIIREESKLQNGLKRILQLKNELYSKDNIIKEFKIDDDAGNNNAENIVLTWQVKSSLIACEAIIRSALMRQESRGAHYRSDFLKLNDETWKVNIYCRYCLNRMLKKSREHWQILLKNTSNQNIIENSNNNTYQWL